MEKNSIAVVVFSLALLASGCSTISQPPRRPVPAAEMQVPQQNVGVRASLEVAGQSEKQELSFSEAEHKTVLQAMKEKYKLETKEFSGVGEYIESINGIKPDKSHFWALYVNGKQAQVGASQYEIKNGDRIEWRLEAVKAN